MALRQGWGKCNLVWARVALCCIYVFMYVCSEIKKLASKAKTRKTEKSLKPKKTEKPKKLETHENEKPSRGARPLWRKTKRFAGSEYHAHQRSLLQMANSGPIGLLTCQLFMNTADG